MYLTFLLIIYIIHKYIILFKVMYVCVILGIPERVDYAPGSGREDLFPTAQLKLCDVPCTVHSVQTKLTLATSHIGKGCDRDTYSVQSQRKLCGNTKAYSLILL